MGTLKINGDILLDGKTLKVAAGNNDIPVWSVYSGEEGSHGFRMQYNGLGVGNNNSLSLIADNQNSDEVKAFTVLQDGTFTFAKTIHGTISTANKWATARTLTIGKTGKSVDGSGNVSWTHYEIGVPYCYDTSPTGSPAYSHQGMLISRAENKYGQSGTGDNYFIGVNSNSQLHIGHQLNGTSTITWTNILSEHNYSSYALPLSGGTLTGSLSVNGALKIGSSNSNYLAFYGTVGDGPSSYTHAYIGERLYGGSESSELLLFKGNDIPGDPGPDRIRHIAAQHLFQVYTTAFGFSETFENVGTSSLPITKLEINSNGIVVNGSCSASSFISSGDFTAPTYIATQRMVISATGLVDLTAAGTTRLYADGLAISNPGTKNDDAWIRVTGTGELDTILEIATGDDGGGLAGTGPEQIVVRQYGGNGIAHQFTLLNTNGDASTTGSIRSNHLYLTPNTYLHMSYNSTDFPVIFNHGNGNVSINACGAGLYLGYSSTTAIYTRGTYTNIDSGNYSSYALPLSGGTMTGRLTFSASGYQTDNIAGYYTDTYGNFRHSRSSSGDHWQFHSYDGSISLKYYADAGILNAPSLATLNYGSGEPGSGTRGYGHVGAIYYKV